ncbi:MAG: hypothetical protein ABI347_04600 [Nitrososphaera sp.]
MSSQLQSTETQPKLLLCNSCMWAATGTSGWKPDRCPACGTGRVAKLAIKGIKAA